MQRGGVASCVAGGVAGGGGGRQILVNNIVYGVALMWLMAASLIFVKMCLCALESS